MADEDKINNLYRQGASSAALILVQIKYVDANEAVSKLSELVDSASASFEALSSGDMEKAYEDLITTGADIIKSINVIANNPYGWTKL